MILCTHCGHQNRNESYFCTFCGNRLPAERQIIGRLTIHVDDEKREYLVGDAERSIGRDPANDIVVDDGEMSGQHARLFWRDECFWVMDLDSTNGTFVNGQRLDGPAPLHDEDLLKMGSTLMKFRL